MDDGHAISVDRKQAEQLKNAGNEHYKNGSLHEAIKFYESAIRIGNEEDLPTYLSNLSAAYYESGNYEKSLDAIDRAFEFLQPVTKSQAPIPLDVKLRVRECRCLFHIQEYDQLLDAVQEIDQAVYDTHSEFGVIEDAALHSLDQLTVWDAERARKVIPSLPRYRPRTKRRRISSTSAIQHDTALSALCIPPEKKGDQNGQRNQRIKITTLQPHQLHLAFFFGNVGDPRHVLATIIDIHQQHPSTIDFSIRMAMTDTNPAIVARNIILFFILDELSKQDLEKREIQTVELLTLLHYTYLGAIMPAWLLERLLGFIRIVSNKLCSGLGIPPWLKISLTSIDQIIPVYKYWIRGAIEAVCIRDFVVMQRPMDGEDLISTLNGKSEFQQRIHEGREQARADIRDAIFNFSDKQLAHILHNKIPSITKLSLKAKKECAYKLFATDEALDQLNRKRYVPDGLLHEYSSFYHGDFKALYGPDVLSSREPRLEAIMKVITNRRDNVLDPNERTTALTSGREYIQSHWRVNVTFIDEASRADRDGILPYAVSFDPFASAQQLVSLTGIRPLAKPTRIYDYTAAFFTNVARSLKQYGNRFLLECMVEESHDVLERINRCPEDSHFDFFDRIFLYASPDTEGGLLPQVVDAISVLKPAPHAFLQVRTLHETTEFETLEDIIEEYTSLPGLVPLARYLGIGVHEPVVDMPFSNHIRLRPVDPANVASIALSSLKSRKQPLLRQELTDWLYQVFLRIAIPEASCRELQQPLNLHSFIRLLIYLQSIDFPAHWISSVLDDIIQNRVQTRARPGRGSLDQVATPISMTPFSMEMEAALTIWFPLLTFSVSAVEFPDATHVRKYSVPLTIHTLPERDQGLPILALWFSTTTSKRINVDLARDIIGSHNAAKSVRLLSTFEWSGTEALFWANESAIELLTIQQFHVRLIRIDRWETISSIVPVKQCIAGDVLSSIEV